MLFNITGACASGREILPADENLKRPINRDPTEDPTCKLAKLDGYTLKKLQADCQQVESKIEEALRDGDAIDVHGAYDIFKKIETSEPMWQRYAEQEKCIQWFDLQKAEDVVGGHFFSLKLFGYWDWKKNEPSEQIKYRYLSFLLAYGAKFKHPLAQYLLAWVMAKSDDDEGLKKAFNNLTIVLKDKEIAEVRFLVGYHYKKQGNPKKSLKIHQAGEDLYNKLAALKIRDYAHYLSNAPTVKEVVKFAEENNCGPAYQLAASIAADKEDYIKYLNAAANLKFHPSLISLGRYYEEINDLAKARECYKKAGEAGFAKGYLHLVFSYIGRIDILPKESYIEQFCKLTTEEQELLSNNFELAGKLNSPQGWICLYELCIMKYIYSDRLNIAKEESKTDAWNALTFALNLGYPTAFRILIDQYHKSTTEAVVANYNLFPTSFPEFHQQLKDISES